MTQAGWYPDPNGKPMLRYFDGDTWTVHTAPPPPPGSSGATQTQTQTLIQVVIWAALVVGVILSLFTSVSLLTGTGKVWAGVAIAAAGMVAALLFRVRVWIRVLAVLLVVACVSGAVYDEVQLQHKRDQLNSILDG